MVECHLLVTIPIQDMQKFHFFIDVASTSYPAAYKINSSLVNVVLHTSQIFENFWKVCCSLGALPM